MGVSTDPAALKLLGLTRYVDASGAEVVRGLDAFYLAHEWRGEPYPASECSEVAWFAPDDLPAGSLPWLAKVMETHFKRRVAFQEDFS